MFVFDHQLSCSPIDSCTLSLTLKSVYVCSFLRVGKCLFVSQAVDANAHVLGSFDNGVVMMEGKIFPSCVCLLSCKLFSGFIMP